MRVGIAVIVDVVFNHLGPSDLDLWRFDGWAEGEWGGIYFYNDERAITPWGATRPDYGRGEVRTFLRDSAMTWLEEFRCDGLRFDATVHIRTVEGYPSRPGSVALPDGSSFLAWINDEIRARQPWKITIAEDIEDDPILVTATADGGAGFGAQWDAGFIRRVRPALEVADDAARDMKQVAAAIVGAGRGEALTRVIYTESHDDVANGLARVPEAITPGGADGWWAKKRAVLGSALVLTSPGIPMLFQGQELLEDGSFNDAERLDWEKASTNRGILRLHRDLIALRRARDGATLGLRGSNVTILRADQKAKVLAMHRWMDGGPHDDTDGRRELRGSDGRRPRHRVPGAGSLERPPELRRVELCPRVRWSRGIRPRCERSAARRLPAERVDLARPIQRRDPVPGGRCAGVRPVTLSGSLRRQRVPRPDRERLKVRRSR